MKTDDLVSFLAGKWDNVSFEIENGRPPKRGGQEVSGRFAQIPDLGTLLQIKQHSDTELQPLAVPGCFCRDASP